MWYSDKTYLLQRSLVYLYQHPRLGQTRMTTLKCLTASIYVDSCFRDLHFSACAIGMLVSKLKSELECFLFSYDLELVEHSEEEEKGLLWICAFGGVAAYGWPERNWFVEQFTSVCCRLGVQDWEQGKSILHHTMWNEKWEDPKGALWRDALERRANIAAGTFTDPLEYRRGSDDVPQYSL